MRNFHADWLAPAPPRWSWPRPRHVELERRAAAIAGDARTVATSIIEGRANHV